MGLKFSKFSALLVHFHFHFQFITSIVRSSIPNIPPTISFMDSSGIGFNHFDVVSEAYDHNFITENYRDHNRHHYDNHNSPVYARIMQEWKILRKGLPDSIYVRVYETRIDLLRAVIVGPSGTPYHDALFFFDIALPANYPHFPPRVHYRSSLSSRLNPNLYTTGKVCLSLINTWHGSKNECWQAGSSTLLQVLVSIQGIVLNARPFFNEPGYEVVDGNSIPSEWIEQSNTYNREAFVLSCYSMMHIMRCPPMNFKELVAHHFQERAPRLLAAIEHYRNGDAHVGQLDDMDSKNGAPVEVPAGFKEELVEIEQYLKDMFDRICTGWRTERPTLKKSSPESNGGKDKGKGEMGKRSRRRHKNWAAKGVLWLLKLFKR